MKKIILLVLVLVLLLTVILIVSVYPKNNKEYINIYQDYIETERLPSGLTWSENQILPSFPFMISNDIDAVNVTNMNENVKIMLVSLQGIINLKQPRIYLYDENSEKDEKWAQELDINLTFYNANDIINKYKHEISGMVVWDENVRDTLNLANTLAGLENLVIVTSRMANKYAEEPFNLIELENYANKFKDKYEIYDYLYENL